MEIIKKHKTKRNKHADKQQQLEHKKTTSM